MTGYRLAAAFGAGFVSVLVFHQGLLALLAAGGLTAAQPWSLAPTAPFGVARVISASFFGGLWGVALAFLLRRFPKSPSYWIVALLFGSIAPSLVAWFVVQPLKGAPVGGGFPLSGVLVALAVNGAWSLGTALLLRIVGPRRPALAI
ncbi:hypothetical protein [Methylopila sp. 73B]|uniref:hypothetical protein n=1 Tax=Methylopila sp. 73B TaxID=1120792 RepID=UPI00055E1BF8|nr:hypothetical protein [Methylopila sp. 73B]